MQLSTSDLPAPLNVLDLIPRPGETTRDFGTPLSDPGSEGGVRQQRGLQGLHGKAHLKPEAMTVAHPGMLARRPSQLHVIDHRQKNAGKSDQSVIPV